jgi:hypothetical protein
MFEEQKKVYEDEREQLNNVFYSLVSIVSKDVPPPSESGYEAPNGGPKLGKTKDGRNTGWVDKKGNIWVPVPDDSPLAHGGGHWDVQYPRGGYISRWSCKERTWSKRSIFTVWSKN